ncbi:hypothetical protein QTP86_003711 [Hemibagrus guttatus]|nr:hypothetical protein QTP86_003711 [Hemibagrus guttatus]
MKDQCNIWCKQFKPAACKEAGVSVQLLRRYSISGAERLEGFICGPNTGSLAVRRLEYMNFCQSVLRLFYNFLYFQSSKDELSKLMFL